MPFDRPKRRPRLALIGNQAFAMLNFRGPLIAALVARGVEVFAIAPHLRADVQVALEKLGATAISYGLNPTGISPIEDVSAAIELYQIFRSIRPDSVLSFTVKPVVFGTIAAWLAGVPKRYALVEGLGRLFSQPRSSRGVLRALVTVLYRLALGRTAKTLFLNKEDMSELVTQGAISDAKAEVIGGIGVDLEQWQMAPAVLEPLTFVFVGRLLKEKGIGDFIEAAGRIKLLHPGVRFFVLGALDKPHGIREADVRQAADAGLIEWLGHVPTEPWLRKASVLVLPSYYREGLPRSLQEAVAMGRPVITTDTPGCRDAVIHGKTGLLVPPRDIGALVDAMLTFVRQPDLIATMGGEGRALAEERFDVHSANRRIINALGL